MTGSWQVNGTVGMFTASNFNVDSGLPGAASNNGIAGGLWNNASCGDTGIYATRALA